MSFTLANTFQQVASMQPSPTPSMSPTSSRLKGALLPRSAFLPQLITQILFPSLGIPFSVCNLQSYCILPDQLIIVMDRYNCSLRNLFAQRLENETAWFNETELLKMTRDLLLGISYLHKEGIAHRDIKVPESQKITFTE